MKEEFLHYLWKYNLYEKESLVDNDNNKIIVINPGEYNSDSGPDFFNARIMISGTEWAGNVEIHSKASHFNIHGHHLDHAFDNVVLHVVAENDKKIFNANGEDLLTVEIKYDPGLYDSYQNLVNNPFIIACQTEINNLDSFFIRHWLHSLLIERLQKKSSAVLKIYSETGNNWDETFYRILSRYFGFRVNTEPFEMLASALPFKIIRKHSDNRFQVEALLYGSSGFLEEGLFREALSDKYYSNLIREYKILSAKYTLKPIHGWLWKFSRLRPVNFPTIRISQLAALLSVSGGIFSRILDAGSTNELKKLFEVTASSYWDEHFVFGKKSRNISKKTGLIAADIFLINAVVPVVFTYGHIHGRNDICERALTFLEEIDPEVNTVTRTWILAGIETESAFYTQALMQLMDEYCRKRKCLECRIGGKLISNGKTLINRNKLWLET